MHDFSLIFGSNRSKALSCLFFFVLTVEIEEQHTAQKNALLLLLQTDSKCAQFLDSDQSPLFFFGPKAADSRLEAQVDRIA